MKTTVYPNPFQPEFIVTPVRAGPRPKPWTFTVTDREGLRDQYRSALYFHSADEAWQEGQKVAARGRDELPIQRRTGKGKR